MASFTPYTYIQCPCHDDSSSQQRNADDAPGASGDETPEDDDTDLDPRAPRSKFSLYPLEYLLYCDVCHQIRCPRCVAEEIVNIYCPNCLFEVATSSLKTEGNRYVTTALSTSYYRPAPLTFPLLTTDAHEVAFNAQYVSAR